ncbi:tetratricopeptide repeat protein [Actinophytocola sp.]|uniref:tetratricopeptide repeat protein n=1 Tax=Actinophytocola sp. TaxID=1872138 RepID=UPI002E176FCC
MPAVVEPIWEKLRAQLALQPGFWLGFLFCSNAFVVDELQARTRNYSRTRLRDTRVAEVDRPEELMAAMSWLLGEHSPDLAAVWLIGVAGEPEPWRPTWATFLRRLNERRDLLRKLLPAGVILVCPPGLLATVREAAPDLWSYRSLMEVVDAVPMPASPVDSRRSATPVRDTDEPDLRWAVEHALEPGIEPSEELRPILRRAAAAEQADHTDDAVSAAREALDAAHTPDDRALAHAWLARALARREDLPAAVTHARRSIATCRPLGLNITDEMLDLLAEASDLDEALPIREAQLDIARLVVAQRGENLESLRDLSVALDRLGRIHERHGRFDQALTYLSESLTLGRRIHDTYGPTPETLQDLALALARIGRAHEGQGQLAEAEAAYAEGVELYQLVREEYGSPLADDEEWEDLVSSVERVRGMLG